MQSPYRLLWWAIAAGLDTIGRWLAHPIPGRRLQSENIPFDAGHMQERCRLFLLITLGETVFTTGTAIAGAPMTLITLVTGTLALAGTVALWALAFRRARHLTLQYVEETRDPVRASRHAVNVLMPMVVGLIAVAVANEIVIAHPRENASLSLKHCRQIIQAIYLIFKEFFGTILLTRKVNNIVEKLWT